MSRYLQPALLGVTALLLAGSYFSPASDGNGPVLTAAVSFVRGTAKDSDAAAVPSTTTNVAGQIRTALDAFAGTVRPLSHPRALQDAFRSYFAFKAANPNEIRKPYLYFVDYGLPSTTPRGYLFDMSSLAVVEGPFTVAHGRGSRETKSGIPIRFSNAEGSFATSLGLYVAQATYAYHGKAGGQPYSSVGLRLEGVSSGFNDNALARHVVAHGAPYVTSARAGHSEGCPAMEPARAKELLPKLADGGMVFLFAPDSAWMASDPWLSADGE